MNLGHAVDLDENLGLGSSLNVSMGQVNLAVGPGVDLDVESGVSAGLDVDVGVTIGLDVNCDVGVNSSFGFK